MAIEISRYFSNTELGCKHCGLIALDPTFAHMLVALRIVFNKPMNPTSICRCPVHNKAVGGASQSLHLTTPAFPQVKGTAAIDVNYSGQPNPTQYRNDLARLAWRMGFRIGYHKTFLHLDSAAHLGALPKSIFSYDSITDIDMARFRDMVIS